MLAHPLCRLHPKGIDSAVTEHTAANKLSWRKSCAPIAVSSCIPSANKDGAPHDVSPIDTYMNAAVHTSIHHSTGAECCLLYNPWHSVGSVCHDRTSNAHLMWPTVLPIYGALRLCGKAGEPLCPLPLPCTGGFGRTVEMSHSPLQGYLLCVAAGLRSRSPWCSHLCPSDSVHYKVTPSVPGRYGTAAGPQPRCISGGWSHRRRAGELALPGDLYVYSVVGLRGV